MKVARACEPASVRLSPQAMRLSYFKNSDFTPSLPQKFPCCLCAARSLISVQ